MRLDVKRPELKMSRKQQWKSPSCPSFNSLLPLPGGKLIASGGSFPLTLLRKLTLNLFGSDSRHSVPTGIDSKSQWNRLQIHFFLSSFPGERADKPARQRRSTGEREGSKKGRETLGLRLAGGFDGQS